MNHLTFGYFANQNASSFLGKIKSVTNRRDGGGDGGVPQHGKVADENCEILAVNVTRVERGGVPGGGPLGATGVNVRDVGQNGGVNFGADVVDGDGCCNENVVR